MFYVLFHSSKFLWKTRLCWWVQIKKSCYGNCCSGFSYGFVQKIEPHPNSCQYPLINYLAKYPRMDCCNGRQDPCAVEILGTLCYCDSFCNRTHNSDCCPDYFTHCEGLPELDFEKAPEAIIRPDSKLIVWTFVLTKFHPWNVFFTESWFSVVLKLRSLYIPNNFLFCGLCPVCLSCVVIFFKYNSLKYVLLVCPIYWSLNTFNI